MYQLYQTRNGENVHFYLAENAVLLIKYLKIFQRKKKFRKAPFTSVKPFIMFSSFIQYSEIRSNSKPEKKKVFSLLIISVYFDAYFRTQFCQADLVPLWLPTKMLLINWLFCNGSILPKEKKNQINSIYNRKPMSMYLSCKLFWLIDIWIQASIDGCWYISKLLCALVSNWRLEQSLAAAPVQKLMYSCQ